MEDKMMVNDALSAVKSSLTTYATVISECSNQELRTAIQQIRDKCETSQYELYKLAEKKGFYKAAAKADESEIKEIKSQFQSK